MCISEIISLERGLSKIPLYDNAAWTTTFVNTQNASQRAKLLTVQRVCPSREYDTFRFGVMNLKVKYMFDERLNLVSEVSQGLGELYFSENLRICGARFGFCSRYEARCTYL